LGRLFDVLAYLAGPIGLFLLLSELQQQNPSWLSLVAAALMIGAGVGMLWRDFVRPWLDGQRGQQ
jgi:hypothetical protein